MNGEAIRMTQPAGDFPVDNATYNLLQALVSKLEAIEAYGRYQQDDGGQIFGPLISQERQQAEQLLTALRQRFGSGVGIAEREKTLVR
jgi:hypothetical protein